MTFIDESSSIDFIDLKKWDKTEYREKKHEIAKACEALIVAQFPEMSGKLKLIDTWTPATYRSFTGSEIGSFMGFTLPSKALPIRISNRAPKLSNVFLATQWQQLPGGLPIAAEGGKLAIETIVMQLRKEEASEKRRNIGRVATVRI